jgi:hypothetical protein
MAEKSYQEQIAEWRVSRRQEQLKGYAEELRENHQEAVRARDQAVSNNDLDAAAEFDDVVQNIEQEWQQHFPPQPARSPVWDAWVREHKSWSERVGPAGVAAVQAALGYMQRPRPADGIIQNPNTQGMGMSIKKAFSPEGMKILEDLLELHGKERWGVSYCAETDKDLTPNKAVEASFGNRTQASVDKYNAGYQTAWRNKKLSSQGGG